MSQAVLTQQQEQDWAHVKRMLDDRGVTPQEVQRVLMKKNGSTLQSGDDLMGGGEVSFMDIDIRMRHLVWGTGIALAIFGSFLLVRHFFFSDASAEENAILDGIQ